MGRKYTICDWKLDLILEEAKEGGFVVSSPMDPRLWTQAESVREAFKKWAGYDEGTQYGETVHAPDNWTNR